MIKLDKKWVLDGMDDMAIQKTEAFAKELTLRNGEKGKALSTSQIRKFFGEVKRIQAIGFAQEVNSIRLLKPKLAYAAGRGNKEDRIKQLYEELSPLIDAIDKVDMKVGEKHFKNFVNIFESIVAFHKAAGGKEHQN